MTRAPILMIVWGGYGMGYLDTGGRYAPPATSWTPTSTGANVPTPCDLHSAIWTGSEMIVWGGVAGRNLNTGARYCVSSACPYLTLSPSTLPDGFVGQPYGQTLTASGGTAPYSFSITAGALPPGLTFTSTGAIAGTPLAVGVYGFAVTVTDAMGCAGSDVYTVAVLGTVGYVVGQGLGQGNPNEVKVYGASGSLHADFHAYAAGQWGVNVAGAGVELGTLESVLTGPGPGAVFGPHVRAFRRDGTPIAKVSFHAYGTLRHGVNVASGTTDSDAYDEILTGAGPGAVFGPHVRGFNYDHALLAPNPKVSFFAYGTLRFGVNVASGDVDGDGWDEILTGAGPGPTFLPVVRGFDVDGGVATGMAKINFSAFLYSSHGANAGAGDVDADAYHEIVVAPGPGPTHPSRFVGFDFDAATITAIPAFDITPFPTLHGGRPGAGDVTNDGSAELLCGAGRDPAADASVRAFSYTGMLSPVPGTPFDPFPGRAYGVNVASGVTGY